MSLGRGCWPEQRAVNKAKPTRDACVVGAIRLCAGREAIRSRLQPAGAAAGFLGRLDEQQAGSVSSSGAEMLYASV